MREVEADKIELLIESALRAPSSRSLNPWEFILVTDVELLGKLSAAKEHGSAFLKGAPLGIVVCADPERCDVWIEDSSIATIFIQMAAEALELGSCWVQIRERRHDSVKTAEEYVRDILNIPPGLKVESIVGIGYSAESKPPHSRDDLQLTKVHLQKYGGD